MTVHLRVYEQPSSLRRDGTRQFVHPADVRGRFAHLRRWLFLALIVILLSLPSVRVGGHPAVFLDMQHRRFFLFGSSFNAQDFWLVFFLLSGLGFALIVVTALWGRVWCGFACPQTVFLEGIYRRVERWIEGPRERRLRRNAGPWGFDKTWRKLTKHVLFVAISLFLAHTFVAYFVSVPALFDMVTGSPSQHPEAFAWSMGMTGILYFNFSWFREQLCLIVCPYGRMQSVLTDQDTIVVGYDESRGEPRGKAKDPGAGDCVDCRRCVVVCPTGIDIRNGLQIDCIGCSQCIDACDEVMDKLGRPRGLIRFDSLRSLAGGRTQWLRPRMYVYAVLGIVGIAVAGFALTQRTSYEANLLRGSGAPFAVEDGVVRNLLQLHLVNKASEPTTFTIGEAAGSTLHYVFPQPQVRLAPLASAKVPILITTEVARMRPDLETRIEVRSSRGETRVVTARFMGPRAP